MASSSSAKKVARVAARSGSGSGPSAGNAAQQRNWLFAVAIVAIVALGVGAVAFARAENEGLSNDTRPLARIKEGEAYDHWHASFALEVCGEELPAVREVTPDPQGIHTHGDGLIHIHPFTARAAGKRATMKKYLDQVDIKFNDNGFTTQDGQSYRAGDGTGDTTACGGQETEVVLAHWKDAATAAGRAPDEIIRKDFGSVRFTEDLGAFTLALIVKGDEDSITAPSASAQIAQLGAADGGTGATDAPVPTEEDTPTVETVPEEGDEATTTAPAGDEATTTAPAEDDEATTTAAPEGDG